MGLKAPSPSFPRRRESKKKRKKERKKERYGRKKNPWGGAMGFREGIKLVLLDSFFEGFEGVSANSFGSWLRGEHHLFACEGVSAFASFGSWLVADFQFKKAWQGEDAWAFFAELFNDDSVEGIENRNDLLFGKLGVFSDGAKDLAFGHGFFLIGHTKKLP
jgi:hypothetical protein